MSRVANSPITLPSGVDVSVNDKHVSVKGSLGTLEYTMPGNVELVQDAQSLTFKYDEQNSDQNMHAGTARALLNNMVEGVSKGFQKKLTLVGVGYRAKVQGKKLNLTLGFSHPVDYEVPEGITIEAPSQTEILVKGADKQKVGQVAADIRSYRPPEPYKGKGIHIEGQHVVRKEAKKK